MSMVILLAPLITAAWPGVAAAVLGSVSAMGYSVVDAKELGVEETQNCVEVTVKNSDVIAETITEDQRITVKKDDITIVFEKTPENKCKIAVFGEGKSDEELRAIGEEVGQAVTQKYIYNKVMNDLDQKDFNVVEEGVASDGTIRLRARRYV